MFHIILLEVVFGVQMQSKIVLFIRPQEFCSYVMALYYPEVNSCLILTIVLSILEAQWDEPVSLTCIRFIWPTNAK
jgi:hypothetical protein